MGSRPRSEPLERIETCFASLDRDDSTVFKTRKAFRLRLGDETIDLSSLEGRRRACLEEHRINEAVARDVSLGVVPVTRDPDGRRRYAGEGDPIDWALHMRRLPDAHRADLRLASGALREEHLEALARRLAAFHEAARGKAGLEDAEVLARVRARIDLRIEAEDWPRRTPLPDGIREIEAWQRHFLEAEAERFLARARGDAIREGHGELSLEHVFVDGDGEVRILAGIEMGPSFRRSDVVADIALLAADLAAHHRVDLAELFVADYARIANDFDFYPLLDFYASLRATLRGKLDWLAADRFGTNPRAAERYRERAGRFFALASAAPRRALLPASVVAMGGQVASGKSTVARHIGKRIGAPVVSTDATRDFLLGARVDADLHEVRWERAYESGFAERVYAESMRRASEVLVSGRPVVVDGCFRSRGQRAEARALAERFGVPFLFVEASVTEAVQLARLAGRAERDSVTTEAWKTIADEMRASWEPAEELSAESRLTLNTALALEENADRIEARLPTWPEQLKG